MEKLEKSLRNRLEKRRYRYLQKTTKSFSLPCNLKKIYLIELIIAKRLGLEDSVIRIINKAKSERSKSSARQAKTVQASPVTAAQRYKPIVLQSNNKTHPYNTRSTKSVVDVINAQSLDGYKNSGSKQIPFKLPKCPRGLNPYSRFTYSHNTQNNVTIQTPVPRERSISGIYPLIQSNKIGLRRKDGTISHINAIVQRQTNKREQIHTNCIQDIINDMEHNAIGENLSVTDSAFSKVNTISTSGSSNVRNLEGTPLNNYMDSLSPISSDEFTGSNAVDSRDMQPLQGQVSSEMERFPMNTLYDPHTNANPILLEGLYYTFRNSLLSTTSRETTQTVYSTPTMVSTMEHASPTAFQNASSTYNPESQPNADNERCASLLTHSENNSKDASASASHVDTDDACDCFTIPEMVEDAFEIMCQDGDYLESIDTDSSKVQCVLCIWVGPAVVLESHIRKAHAHLILKQTSPEWYVTITLGSEAQPLWCNTVLEFNSELFVLSAKHENPDCFTATLSCLAPAAAAVTHTASITTYNIATGEPHSWQGDVGPMPPYLPYDNLLNGLKLTLASLDLLPAVTMDPPREAAGGPSREAAGGPSREAAGGPSREAAGGPPNSTNIHITLFVSLH